MSRPPKSEKWSHTTELDLILSDNDEVEYSKTNAKGYPLFTRSTEFGKKCTVIIGLKRARSKIRITPSDEVRTCSFNYRGNIQSLGIPNAEKDITIIIHK